MKFLEETKDPRSYVKLADKQSIVGVFAGSPENRTEFFYFRDHWQDKRTVKCDGPGCKLCESGSKSSFKFRANFITKDENGNYVAKVWQGGWDFYNQLKALDTECKIDKTILKITRHGMMLNTNYVVVPTAQAVTVDLENKLLAVPLNDLRHLTKAETEGPDVSGMSGATHDEDIPF